MSQLVTLHPDQAAQALNKLGMDMAAFPKQFKAALLAALNRSGVAVGTRARQLISSRYSIRSGEINNRLSLEKASSQRLAASFTGRGRPLTLARFNAKPKTIKIKPKVYVRHSAKGPVKVAHSKARPYYGVTVKVLKASSRKLVKKGFFANARAGLKDGAGARLIFKPFGAQRRPGVLRGPSLVGLLNDQQNTKELYDLARETLTRRLQHEADYRLQKLEVRP